MNRRQPLLIVAVVAILATVLLLPRAGRRPLPTDRTSALPPVAPPLAASPPPTPHAPGTPVRIVLDHLADPESVGVQCWPVQHVALLHVPPGALDHGPWSDRLGSMAHANADLLLPPDPIRRRLDRWGLTPGRVGHALKDVGPWTALVALEAERYWSRQRGFDRRQAFEDRYGVGHDEPEGRTLRASDPKAAAFRLEPDRSVELQLARALAGDDAVGQRARMAEARSLADLAADEPWSQAERHVLRQQSVDKALDVLHGTDDPGLLTTAATQLGMGSYDTTPEDDARILEVMELLPPAVGRPLALVRVHHAWEQNDREEAMRWWSHYEPLVDHCASLSDEEELLDGCGCVPSAVQDHTAAFLHKGWLEPTTLQDRLLLASARCHHAGHRADALEIDPSSDLGRCIQQQLGDDVVLGRDVELAYPRVGG